MKEIYKVKPPERIVFGDPMYFEQCKKEELKRLTVDYKPSDSFSAKVVLEETPYEECPDEMCRAMSIYFAPSQTIDVSITCVRKNFTATIRAENTFIQKKPCRRCASASIPCV